MNKRPVRAIIGLTIFLVLIFLGILAYDDQYDKEDFMRPNRISSYQDSGYFKIDPNTILPSLEGGNAGVFTPLSESEALGLEELTNVEIYWTQADFLKIASTLGRLVWNDPMDLKEWSIYSVSLQGSCGDPVGFDSAKITYFQVESKGYNTRLIEIDPRFGWARWGSGATYPKPLLQKWKTVDVLRSKITADDALQIVSEDVKARVQIKDNICGVDMHWPQGTDYKNWNLAILLGPLDHIVYLVDLNTGIYIIRE